MPTHFITGLHLKADFRSMAVAAIAAGQQPRVDIRCTHCRFLIRPFVVADADEGRGRDYLIFSFRFSFMHIFDDSVTEALDIADDMLPALSFLA